MKYISFIIVTTGILILSSCGTFNSAEFNSGFRDGWNSTVTDEYRY
jgi:hypothetical protein